MSAVTTAPEASLEVPMEPSGSDISGVLPPEETKGAVAVTAFTGGPAVRGGPSF